MLCCPRCQGELGACGHDWPTLDNGLPDLVLPASDEALTAKVGAFYEESPFPDWRPEDDRSSLLRRGRDQPLTRWLDETIDHRASVVELGCGTGQMSLFLGLCGRPVLGVDLSAASLRVAEGFRARLGLRNVRLARGTLFAPPVRPGSAQVGISSGVLHHTADPRGGFASLVRAVAPGGLVVVGLYNTLGRLLLPLLRSRHRQDDSRRGRAWYRDQHEHPHESRHTTGELLRWMDEEGVSFLRAFPDISFAGPEVRGAAWEQALIQLSWLNRAADGGLFVLVGVKRG